MSKNFKCLDELIHSGETEISLDSDVVLENVEEMEYFEGISLDVDDIVIDGNGFCVDAGGKTRIFHCTGENVVIKNLTFKNGFSKENGGVIHIDEGELTVLDSRFFDNVSGEDGGAIFNEDGVLTVGKSIFFGIRLQILPAP